MKVRVFLPAADRLEPSARLAWKLFDGRDNFLREDTSRLADIARAEEVELIVPAERVLFARIKLPRVSAGTIRELLPYAVEDRLLADPSHIHATPGKTNARGETIVAVVDREWLRGMVDALAHAGLRPAKAWSESALLAGGRDDWHIVLGPTRGMLVDDEGVSATFDRGAGFPLAVRIALDEAAARGERPNSIRVHTDNVALPELDRWSAEGGVPFTAGTQWEVLARGHPGHDSINLLVGELSPASRTKTVIPRAAIWLAIAILNVQLLFSVMDEMRLERERRQIESRREAIFRSAFPEARVVVDPELQMARNLAELRRARGLAAGDDFLAQMTRAANGATHVSVVEYQNGRLVTR